MDATFWTLAAAQVVNLLVYKWVGAVFLSQPRFNHPMMFHNPTARLLLAYGPLVIMVVLIVLAFFLTDSPWWFLAGSLVLWVAWSRMPNPEMFR